MAAARYLVEDELEQRLVRHLEARGRYPGPFLRTRAEADSEPSFELTSKVVQATRDAVVADAANATIIHASYDIISPLADMVVDHETSASDDGLEFVVHTHYKDRMQYSWITTVAARLATKPAFDMLSALWDVNRGLLLFAEGLELQTSGPPLYSAAGIVRRLIDEGKRYLVKRSNGVGVFSINRNGDNAAVERWRMLMTERGVGTAVTRSDERRPMTLLIVGANGGSRRQRSRAVRANPATQLRINGRDVRLFGQRLTDGTLQVVVEGLASRTIVEIFADTGAEIGRAISSGSSPLIVTVVQNVGSATVVLRTGRGRRRRVNVGFPSARS